MTRRLISEANALPSSSSAEKKDKKKKEAKEEEDVMEVTEEIDPPPPAPPAEELKVNALTLQSVMDRLQAMEAKSQQLEAKNKDLEEKLAKKDEEAARKAMRWQQPANPSTFGGANGAKGEYALMCLSELPQLKAVWESFGGGTWYFPYLSRSGGTTYGTLGYALCYPEFVSQDWAYTRLLFKLKATVAGVEVSCGKLGLAETQEEKVMDFFANCQVSESKSAKKKK